MIEYLKSNFFTLSLLALVIAFILYQRLPVYMATRPLVDQPAPDFFLPTLDPERPVRLSDYRGKKVLLNFWATWCGPCVREVPDLAAVHAELTAAGENFEMLSITADDPATVRRFAENHEIEYPIVLDPTGVAHELYKVSLFPTMVWIDEDGRVESFGHGADYILKQKIRFWVTGGIFEAAP
ncbi:MAG: TlpA family protein disulfide reductase [bacterium]|nr:TlpA family protein disulfide reductase [bacterium]